MDLLLQLVDDNLVIAPEALLIPEFKTLWDRDHHPNKLVVKAEFKYLVIVHGWKSPVWGKSGDDRRTEALKYFDPSWEWEPDNEFKAAEYQYNHLQESANPSIRLLNRSRDWLFKIETQYDTKEGELIESIDVEKVTKFLMKDLPLLLEHIEDLRKKVMLKDFELKRHMGDKSIGHFEKV